MALPYIQSGERVVGQGNGLYADTLNRALRAVLSGSGHNPDAITFPGIRGPVCNVIAFGADATGAADSSAAFLLAQTAASLGQHVHVPAGTFRIAANTTMTASLDVDAGAVIQPTTGHNFAVNGRLYCGLHKCFDTALGGTFSFGMAGTFRAEWFLVADGNTNDTSAFTSMIASLADYSKVIFGAAMKCGVGGEWEVLARRGIELIGETLPFPDGANAATLLWQGPPPIYGTDANTTAASAVVTTTTGQFTPAMVGRRLIIKGNLNGKIVTYTSATSVTLDTTALFNQAGVPYTVGGVMVSLTSCDHCNIRNLSILPTGDLTTQMGFGGYIASGANVLTDAGFGRFTSGMVGKMIRVEGAGPGGTDLITTIAGFTNANVVTLTTNASTTILSTVLTRYIVSGTYTNSLPAVYAILGDKTGVNGVTGTNCYFTDNLIRHIVNYQSTSIALSITSQSNQEYHRALRNTIHGGDFGIFEAPSGAGVASITGGTNVFNNTENNMTLGFVGMRLRVANAGPSGGLLDTKIIQRNTSSQVLLKDNASTTANPTYAIVGENRSIGIEVGKSPNVKKITIRDNILSFYKWGVYQGGGSIEMESNSYTSCEADLRVDGSSEAGLVTHHNSEQALRAVDNDGGNLPITFKGCRFGNLVGMPNGGYVRFGVNGNYLIFEQCGFDNLPFTGSTIYEFNGGAPVLVLRENEYYNGTTMAMAGLTAAKVQAGSAVVKASFERKLVDQPAPEFIIAGVPAPNLRHNETLFNGGSAVLDDTLLTVNGDSVTGVGLRSRIEATGGTMSGEAAAAIEASIGQINNWSTGMSGVGMRVRLPTKSGFNAAAQPIKAFQVLAPNLASGTIQDVYGIEIQDLLTLSAGNVWRGHAINQLGLSDTNLLNGITTFGSGRVEKGTVYIDIAAAGNATPNAAGAEEYRYRMAGAATVNNPTNLVKGSMFKLVMFNNTGGAITPALGAAFLGTGFGAIGAGKSRSRMYMYDDVAAKLEPIGAVSEDF